MVKLELKDKSPFFIRPYPVKEDGKKVIDDEMRKGCWDISRKGCHHTAILSWSYLERIPV